MSDPDDAKDLDAERDWMMEVWHEYGRTFNSFVPSEQPDPHDWDRPFPSPEESGILDPQALKHWRYFEKNRGFLRQRYSVCNGSQNGN